MSSRNARHLSVAELAGLLDEARSTFYVDPETETLRWDRPTSPSIVRGTAVAYPFMNWNGRQWTSSHLLIFCAHGALPVGRVNLIDPDEPPILGNLTYRLTDGRVFNGHFSTQQEPPPPPAKRKHPLKRKLRPEGLPRSKRPDLADLKRDFAISPRGHMIRIRNSHVVSGVSVTWNGEVWAAARLIVYRVTRRWPVGNVRNHGGQPLSFRQLEFGFADGSRWLGDREIRPPKV